MDLSFKLGKGTVVAVNKKFDASLPIVVLLHGLGGSSLDMTAPAISPDAGGLAFDRTTAYTVYKNRATQAS